MAEEELLGQSPVVGAVVGAGIIGIGRHTGAGDEACGGVMFTCHKRDPCSSCIPCKIGSPCLFLMVRLCSLSSAVQSTSHNFPMLMRLFVKPGMMWPNRAVIVGMEGMGNCAEAMEVSFLPVAVRIVVDGATAFLLTTGAAAVKLLVGSACAGYGRVMWQW